MSVAHLLFWLAATWILYVYVGYPVLLAVASLIFRVRPSSSQKYEPTVSVLMAAHNEERDLKWKIDETLAWDYPASKIEILVASDASEDDTDKVLASIDDSRLHWIRTERRSGKVRALNQLVKMARGEILFFTDANAHIDAESLRYTIRHFSDLRVGCVTGDSAVITDKACIGSGAATYWNYEKIIKRLESKMGAVLVCDGAIFCIRRELYVPCQPELANDFEIPLRIAHQGYWILHEPQAKAFEKDTTSVREDFQRRRRMCAQGVLGIWLLWSTLRGIRLWEMISHKLLRWLTLTPAAMILATSLVLSNEPFYRVALVIQLVVYTAAALGLVYALIRKPTFRLFSVPFYALLGTAGTFVGVFEALMGRKFAVWEVAHLSRGV